MTRAKQTFVVALGIGAILAGASSAAFNPPVLGQQSSLSSAAPERSIEGVWRTVVTTRNCQTGQVFGVIHGLFTFHAGGTMSEFGVAPGTTPALRSPGHGVWHREQGWRDYSFAFTFNRYDASGVFLGLHTSRATLELAPSGNEFTTQSVIEVLDADNRVIATACATSAGSRFE